MMAAAPLYVVGLGPGDPALITPLAIAALKASAVIAGYSLYIELVPEELKAGKKIIATGMRQETERCSQAIAEACAGNATSLVCSGDPGIYAMASLVIELLATSENSIPLEIIPGVPAFCAAAAKLGAPLGHDFACISLSDLLTPLEVIEKRLEAALSADFVCVLYNPASRGRPDYLARALAIAAKYRSQDCPVGLVRNAGRKDEKVVRSDIAHFDCAEADMLCLVIIGNNETRMAGRWLLTPRGYHRKKDV